MSIFVFDLDGTLIDSSKLTSGRKTSWQVLELDHPLNIEIYSWDDHQSTRNWSLFPNVQETLDLLLARGHQVVIATRAPLSYASTILHLARMGYSRIYASCGPNLSKSKTLLEIADFFKTDVREITYVGDLDEDRDIAALVGAKFVTAMELWAGALISTPTAGTSSALLLEHTDVQRTQALSNEDCEIFLNHYGLATPKTSDEKQQFNSPLPEEIIKSFKEGIPDPRRHSQLLFQLLNVQWRSHLRLFKRNPFSDLAYASQESRQLVAGLAVISLLSRPGTSERNTWQLLALSSWENGVPSRCLIQCEPSKGVFQLDPSIFSRYEVDQFLSSDDAFPYLRFVNSIFPAHQGEIQWVDQSLRFTYSVRYGAREGDLTGYVLSHAKNYHYEKGSGPDPILGLLDFVSDICASSILSWLERDLQHIEKNKFLLVPVPSNNRTSAKPAEMSNRLVLGIATRLQTKQHQMVYAPILLRDDNEDFSYDKKALDIIAEVIDEDISSWPVIIIDDQCTNGGSLIKADQVFADTMHEVEGVFVFSKSRYEETIPSCCLDLLSRAVGLTHKCTKSVGLVF
jgi:hypothetical protein